MSFEPKEKTLCWQCKKACTGGCSWARDFTPVEYWDAELTMVGHGIGSALVRWCPEYAYEDREKRQWDLNTAGCVNLVERLMEITHTDYVEGGDQQREEIRRFLRGRGASRVHQLANPEAVIEMLDEARAEYVRKKAQRALIGGR